MDHTIPISQGGRTCLENLNRQCRTHHWLKTFGGWRLSGGLGAWAWEPPRVAATGWGRSPP
ncbi:MAG: HNH endonuclease signature motif containing protein [Actinomycetota bacterium]